MQKPAPTKRTSFRCSNKDCPNGTLRWQIGPGRATKYRNLPEVKIPENFPLLTCQRCHTMFFDTETAKKLRPILHQQYVAELRRRIGKAIDVLCKCTSQRRLERVLGLSHGYLSRLRTGAGNPSAELVSNLALLAGDPQRRLAELQNYWSSSKKGSQEMNLGHKDEKTKEV